METILHTDLQTLVDFVRSVSGFRAMAAGSRGKLHYMAVFSKSISIPSAVWPQCTRVIKAKFRYAIWFEAGSKLVADRFEAGRRPALNQIA